MPKKFPPEARAHAIRMTLDQLGDYDSVSTAPKLNDKMSAPFHLIGHHLLITSPRTPCSSSPPPPKLKPLTCTEIGDYTDQRDVTYCRHEAQY